MKFPFRIPSRKKKEKKPVKEESSVKYVFEKLSEARMEKEKVKSVIMGVGNDLKGDDGIGWYVVEKLRKSLGERSDMHFIKVSVPENHVSEVRDLTPDVVIIIDSADFKGSPGDIRLIGEGEVSSKIGGTHSTPITLFMRLLLEGYDTSAPTIVLVGIQQKQTGFGMPMSSEVRKAGDRIVKLVKKLYRGGLLEENVEREIELLTTKNPLKRISKIVDKVREAGKGEE
ncbi:MAG: hydrogenase maturation protease [Candidatus Aenigmarchaeota archaeon]|nr:hydrogenase maturation protease [Candidatus Aenigmarchaeota archaeon]